MSLERLKALTERFRSAVPHWRPGMASPPPPDLPGLELLESMLLSRWLDRAALELREEGLGHYTISSAGHEFNAVLGRLTSPGDPAIVHYRSAAFQLERARQVRGVDGVLDLALSLVASSDEPTSGGRHKVLGGRHLGMLPSTSTIASHLPRALGLAVALGRVRRGQPRHPAGLPVAPDALVVATFGDASLNHSTAQGALNAAGWTAHQLLEVPLLLVCEDNGLGISVKSPEGWIELRLRQLPHITYYRASGADLAEFWVVARQAVDAVRATRRPAVLHLPCVRLLGHAGSDVDTVYRSPAEIEAALAADPLLSAARGLVESGAASAEEILALDLAAEARVAKARDAARRAPRLTSRAAVMSALVAPVETGSADPHPLARTAPTSTLTLAQGITHALTEWLEGDPTTLLFGEDVARKGGVYGVTRGLWSRFGGARVFNTLLDESSILGMALGAASLGYLPIPEIQYLAYLHNAEDQLRGEALTARFFSGGNLDNPFLLRIAGYAYQKGFGGHFHNDHSLGVLRDLPGVVVFTPARGDDALELYRTAHSLCVEARRVVVAVEPIALYHTRDLHEEGDGAFLGEAHLRAAEPFRARTYHEQARDLLLVTYGNGVHLCLRAARTLEARHGVAARVLDLRWLVPLPIADLVRHATQVGAVLIVDECRRSGNVSEGLMTALVEECPAVRAARVTAADCLVPLGDAARLVLVSEDEIVTAALSLVRRPGAV